MAGDGFVLGIESSCDEMAAAVVETRESATVRVVASIVHGQDRVHAPYGGVVPELASRDHLSAISSVVEAAMRDAGLEPERLSGIAVTAGPGLMGSLLVGLSFGKALAYRAGVPWVGVHHLAGHLAAAELTDPSLRPPYLGLVVSGGHTALYRIDAEAPVLLGETRDDAAGEAFDKVAKLLGLPFPGGPALSACAEAGDERAVAFPRPLGDAPGYDFSYSGLKTAVLLEVARRRPDPGAPLAESERADVAASFQAAATDVLVNRTRRAAREQGLGRVAVVGGVAANGRLRRELERAAREDGFALTLPPPHLCTDNAAMIAAAGARLLARGESHGLELSAFSRLPMDGSGLGAPPDRVS
jgi:N6-L-threonylcarbamoyladenine synthase